MIMSKIRQSSLLNKQRKMSSLTSIKDISHDKIKKLFDSVDHVFFDIDGVLILNKTLIPGAAETVEKLRKLGKTIAFVSNNSIYPLRAIRENLKAFGATEDEIITPNASLLAYLKKIEFKDDIYVISNKLPKQLLREAGYKVIEYKDIYLKEIEESVGAIEILSLKALDVCKNVKVVHVDFDFNFYMGDLQVAKVILNHMDDVLFLSGPDDDKCNVNEKIKFIGSKYYIDGLERLTKRKPIKLAKPSSALKDVLNSKFNIKEDHKVLFIGDNVDTDIAFGINSGFKTCLTLSGVTSKNQVEEWQFSEHLKPTYVIESIDELYQKIIDL